MNFWETEGANIDRPRIDELLGTQPTLDSLFNDTTFMDEFYSQKPRLIEYLATPEHVRQMIEFIYDVDKMTHLSYKQQCDYAFIAFNVLSSVNPQITQTLYRSPELLEFFFSIEARDMNAYITSQGYFQAIVKNMLLDINPLTEEFVRILKADAERRIFPLARNLSRSNSEIIKEILSSTKSYIKKLQNCLFEYLLFYFLNEQFQDSADISEMFDNLNDLFTFLRREGSKYEYKMKYEYTLYSDKYVKNTKYKREIYTFKLVLLKYLAETKQIARCETPELFVQTYKEFAKTEAFVPIVNSLLELFRILALNPDFQAVLAPGFIDELILIIKATPKNDIVHKNVFEIFKLLHKYISAHPLVTNRLCDFLLEIKPQLRLPMEAQGFKNQVSLNFVFHLLNDINLDMVDQAKQEPVRLWRDQLSTVFTKLCFDPSLSKLSNLDESSEVQIIVSDNFRFIGDERPGENRDLAEDRIKEPDPLNSPTKNHLHYNVSVRDGAHEQQLLNDRRHVEKEIGNRPAFHDDVAKRNEPFSNNNIFNVDMGDQPSSLQENLFSPFNSNVALGETQERATLSDNRVREPEFEGGHRPTGIFDISEFKTKKTFDEFDAFNK